jgi:hypothetical protein
MGNLISSLTYDEWEDIVDSLDKEKKKGRPDEYSLNLVLMNKDVEELKIIKEKLSDHFGDFQLRVLNEWISYKEKG